MLCIQPVRSQVASLQQAILGTFPTLPEPRSYTANIGDYLMVGTLSFRVVGGELLHLSSGYYTDCYIQEDTKSHKFLSIPFSMYFP